MSRFRSLALASVLLQAAWAWSAPVKAAPALQSVEIITTSGVHVFAVELAATDAEVTQGLKGRTSVPDGSGMLFDFRGEVQVNMSMKDTPVALDMIFIRADGRISRVAENQTPMSERQVYSGGPVRAVLEVPAGTARRYGIAAGDRVSHRIFTSR